MEASLGYQRPPSHLSDPSSNRPNASPRTVPFLHHNFSPRIITHTHFFVYYSTDRDQAHKSKRERSLRAKSQFSDHLDKIDCQRMVLIASCVLSHLNRGLFCNLWRRNEPLLRNYPVKMQHKAGQAAAITFFFCCFIVL